MKVARQLRQVADVVVTGAEINSLAVICSNVTLHEVPDQTSQFKCRLAGQSPIKSTLSTEIANGS